MIKKKGCIADTLTTVFIIILGVVRIKKLHLIYKET